MSEEVIMGSEQPVEPEKKYRRRKKQLYKNIRNQMEFYFSDANLSKNRFIGQLIQQDPFIDLSVFLGFNKIRALTTCIEDIAGSLKHSTVLKLNEESTKVARIAPFEPKLDSDECTIYVEQLPLDATHEWLKNKFSTFGQVVYISIPKYKTTGKIKGFAFVEFDTVFSAQKALHEYISMGCCLPPQMLPEELCSISAFQDEELEEMYDLNEPIEEAEAIQELGELSNKEEEVEEETSLETNKKPKKKSKRKLDECLLDDSSSNKKEESNQTDDSKEKPAKRKKLMPEDESNQTDEKIVQENTEIVENKEECKETKNNPEEKENKKKRKRKKNKKMKIQTEEIYKMQIMPKKEWKRLRNKYLELQKSKMKNLKQYLNKVKWANTPQKNPPIENPKQSDQKNLFEYMPGVILKVAFDEPIKDVKNFKLQAHGLENIKYIDISEGANEAYIRFSSVDSASNALVKKLWENTQILEGKEDEKYWEKMEKDRKERFQHRIKPKTRGRTKLLKRAEKALGKHIRFD